MTKPDFLDIPTYNILKEKYKDNLDEILLKIKNGYPVQYLIGNVPFYGLTINVDERCLIPRFETELLVDNLVKILAKYNFKPTSILDICTGSGCIALSLKNTYKDSSVVGVDISKDALSLARENSKLNNLDVKFIKKDILKDFNFDSKFDILVSNPPYVKHSEYTSPETKYEPSIALYPGDDNLIFYKQILKNAKNILTSRSVIAFEIGAYDSLKITKIARGYFTDSDIFTLKDYNNFDRFIFILNNL